MRVPFEELVDICDGTPYGTRIGRADLPPVTVIPPLPFAVKISKPIRMLSKLLCRKYVLNGMTAISITIRP